MVQGTVSGIMDTNYRGTTLWSFQLQGDNTFYRTGQTKPSCEVGSYIGFEMKDANKNTVNTGSIKILDRPPSKSNGANGSAPAQSGGNFMDTRQQSIIYQSSRKDAIEAARMVLDHADDRLPASMAEIMDLIDDITKKYVGDVENLDPVNWTAFAQFELAEEKAEEE